MTSTNDIYEQLRAKVDTVGFGFPESAPVEEGDRPEIAVLKSLFSPEDAEIFVAMRAGYQTAEEFAAQAGVDVEYAKSKLHEMSKRGQLYRRGSDRGPEYRLIPLAHGIFEFAVDDPNMAAWFPPFVQYLGSSTFMGSVTGTDTPFERTVPSRADMVEGGILPQDDIVAMVNEMDYFAVTDCLCRKAPATVGAPLNHPLRTCMYTGEWARYAVENGFAEEVTREDILQIMRDSEAAGRMTQVLNSDKPEVICSCDGERCLVLVQHKLGLPGPARVLRSNYCAKLDEVTCTDCEACIPHCPVDALVWTADEHVRVDLDMCCGCGLCLSPCPSNALVLVKKDAVYQPGSGGAFTGYDRQAAYRNADPDTIGVR